MSSIKKTAPGTKNTIKSLVVLVVAQKKRRKPDPAVIDHDLQAAFLAMFNDHRIWQVDQRLERIHSFIHQTSTTLDNLLDFQITTILQAQQYVRKMCDYDEEELSLKKSKPDLLQKILEERMTERRLRIVEQFLTLSHNLDEMIKALEANQVGPGPDSAAAAIEKRPAPTEKEKVAPAVKRFSIRNIGLVSAFAILSVVAVIYIRSEDSHHINHHSSKPIMVTSVPETQRKGYVINKPSTAPQKETAGPVVGPELHVLDQENSAAEADPDSIEHEVALQPTVVPTPLQLQKFREQALEDISLTPYRTLPLNIIRGDPQTKNIAFTFDGDSQGHDTGLILEILEKYAIKCTFFLTGKFIEHFPEETKMIVAAGHEVGNHLYSHPHMATLTEEQFAEELVKANQAFYKLCGQPMAPFWRAPYGEYEPRHARIARKLGFVHIHWTHGTTREQSLDTIDWVEDPNSKLFRSSERILEHILKSEYKAGGIILLHVGTREHDPAYTIFPELILSLQNQGYTLVQVSEMLQGLIS